MVILLPVLLDPDNFIQALQQLNSSLLISFMRNTHKLNKT